jgi:hypothetical protein
MAEVIKLSSGAVLSARLLTGNEYFGRDADFYATPAFNDFFSFDHYIREKRGTEVSLRSALARRWENHVDFEVGDDENIAFTMCGGVYTPRTFCRDYLECLYGVLQATVSRDKWMYDTSIELAEPVDGMQLCTFRIHADEVDVCMDYIGRFDFIERFSRPSKA